MQQVFTIIYYNKQRIVASKDIGVEKLKFSNSDSETFVCVCVEMKQPIPQCVSISPIIIYKTNLLKSDLLINAFTVSRTISAVTTTL